MAVRVFLVEDTRPMQQLIRDLLESIGGYELVGAAAGETPATDWLLQNRGRWDLAIVDLLLAEGFAGRRGVAAARGRGGFRLVVQPRRDEHNHGTEDEAHRHLEMEESNGC